MDEFARLITVGERRARTPSRIMGQVFAATAVLDFFTGLTREFPFEEIRHGMMGPVLVRHEPVGVAAGIIPWNVPLFIIMLKLAPALASGSTIVLKPAPETPLDANVLAEILEEAGLPAGVVNIVPAGREVGEHLVRHPDIDKVGVHRLAPPPAARSAPSAASSSSAAPSSSAASRPPSSATTPTSTRSSPTLHAGGHHEQRPGLRGPDPHPRPPQPLRRGA